MKNLRGANISQKRGSKGPVERSIERKNMQPIKIDPELSKAYQRHEQATKDHVRMHRLAEKERDKSARGGS